MPTRIVSFVTLLVALALSGTSRPALAMPPAGTPTERAVDPRPGVRAGDVFEYRIRSMLLASVRRTWVYTPPGYNPMAKDGYPLVVAFDGAEYLDSIPLPLMLDTLLAARRAPPFIAILIDDSTSTARLGDLANRARFVRFVCEEVIPWAHAHWNIDDDPRHAIVTGSSAGGLAAAYVALERPDLLGNVLSQSGAFWRGAEGSNAAPFEWLTGRYAAAPRRDLRLLLEVGSRETNGAIGGTAPSLLEANRRLRDTLVRKGYPVTYAEVEGGVHSPLTWRTRLADAIAAMAQWPDAKPAEPKAPDSK